MSRHGALHLGGGVTRFSVWAPRHERVSLVRQGGLHELEGDGQGNFEAIVSDAGPGTRYRYLLDGDGPFADPASRSQPDGVHGPSEVVGRQDKPLNGSSWRGVPLSAQVVCELHVGTYTALGTFKGVIGMLDHLASAGYTAIELMPISEFPGSRNWGYDGVFPYAVQSSYGGPGGLVELVAAAHEHGLAVIVDAVYNHIGPEGAVHDQFGPYFTDRYATPWGRAVNFDGPGSDAVRAYFIGHACYLVGELGVDGLRLDAVHEIVDPTASPFLAELTTAVEALARAEGRVVTVVAESSANDPRLTSPVSVGGLGCGASWNDDLHHALRATVTGDSDRWFADYHGIEDLATAMTDGWVLTGRESANFGRRHGARLPRAFSGERLVAFAQNHDQIGNAGYGQRLAARLPLEAQFAIAAAILLSPFVPLRFMGEEYGETAPFDFFTSHSDPELIEAVREGRAAEVGDADPEPCDPQDPQTFAASRPNDGLALSGIHRELLEWQKQLLALRRSHRALGSLEPSLADASTEPTTGTLTLVRHADRYLDAECVAMVWRCVTDEEAPGAPGSAGQPADVGLGELCGARWQVLAAYGAESAELGDELDWSEPGSAGLHLGPYAVVVLGRLEPIRLLSPR